MKIRNPELEIRETIKSIEYLNIDQILILTTFFSIILIYNSRYPSREKIGESTWLGGHIKEILQGDIRPDRGKLWRGNKVKD